MWFCRNTFCQHLFWRLGCCRPLTPSWCSRFVIWAINPWHHRGVWVLCLFFLDPLGLACTSLVHHFGQKHLPNVKMNNQLWRSTFCFTRTEHNISNHVIHLKHTVFFSRPHSYACCTIPPGSVAGVMSGWLWLRWVYFFHRLIQNVPHLQPKLP